MIDPCQCVLRQSFFQFLLFWISTAGQVSLTGTFRLFIVYILTVFEYFHNLCFASTSVLNCSSQTLPRRSFMYTSGISRHSVYNKPSWELLTEKFPNLTEGLPRQELLRTVKRLVERLITGLTFGARRPGAFISLLHSFLTMPREIINIQVWRGYEAAGIH
jgi:hypothetical protein